MAWNIQLPDAAWIDPDQPGSAELIAQLKEELRHTFTVALDTETTGLDKMRDLPLYWTLGWRDRQGAARRVCMPASTLHLFTEIFAKEDRQWVFANAKYDCAILANVGIEVKGEAGLWGRGWV